ncbi:hypothetical protein V6N13_066711 [Hibiscus sabdariffa]|uniref:Vacuole membrane protein KMS1 n=1 Tax=Hibiscus sabdariffa TaxID=183260 RepID=A0ABR2DRB3_9ROSI
MATTQVQDLPISGLHEKHREELGNLTLTTQPLRTLKLFVFAVTQWIHQAIQNRAGWFMFSSILAGSIGILVVAVAGPHEMIQELFHYFQFGVWWLALGVASSIGLGSGLHTFVLYLGPHIAFFTMKAVQCGRVDLKTALYDTIRLNNSPSWLNKSCSEYGPPLFPSAHGSRVPLNSILPQVQLEAILWGIGTALGELPPYFISRAARISGSKLDIMNDLGSSPMEDGSNTANHLKQIKNWLLSHSQYLNFFTILFLASVPNPLFDLAGIMCGQFGIPFWKFFLATLLGKAIIKTHIQTAFIISVCNYQLLDFIENEFVRVLSFIPGLVTVMPDLIGKLHTIRDKYMSPSPPVSDNIKVNKWGLSVASIWNTVVWLMLLNLFIKIVTATAQNFLKEQQEKELIMLSNNSSESDPLASKSI